MTRRGPALCLEFIAGDAFSVRRERPSYATGLAAEAISFETHVTGGVGWARIFLHILWMILRRRPRLVISCEYRRAFLVNLALLLTFCHATHVVLGMNLSARPIVARKRLVQRVIDRIFRRSNAIVVHSTREAELFARLHNLPAGRFAFSHWGYDLPAESNRFDGASKPYFCMIGRNNRDVETFAKALDLAGTRGVAILPGYLPLDPSVEQALEVHRDLPMADCVSCIRNAIANVTLLRDDSRGAGHITVVTAMHLGVPQIHSETEVLREYLCLPVFSRPVPIGDAEAVARAMRAVIAEADTPEASDRAAARRDFARLWLSNESAARRISGIICATLEGRQIGLADPEWESWLDRTQPNRNADAGPID